MSDEPKEMFGKGEQLDATLHAIRYAYRIGFMRGAIEYAPVEGDVTIKMPDPSHNEVTLMFLLAESKRLGLDDE